MLALQQNASCYVDVLKTVLKNQIQHLVRQLQDEAGEETLLLTASVKEGTSSYLGSNKALDFMQTRKDVKSLFFDYCLHAPDGEKSMMPEGYHTDTVASVTNIDTFHPARDDPTSLLHWLEKGTPEKKRKHSISTCSDSVNVDIPESPIEKTYAELQNVKAVRIGSDPNTTESCNTATLPGSLERLHPDTVTFPTNMFNIDPLTNTVTNITVPAIDISATTGHQLPQTATMFYPQVFANSGTEVQQVCKTYPSITMAPIKQTNQDTAGLGQAQLTVMSPVQPLPIVSEALLEAPIAMSTPVKQPVVPVNTPAPIHMTRRTTRLELPASLKPAKKTRKKRNNKKTDASKKTLSKQETHTVIHPTVGGNDAVNLFIEPIVKHDSANQTINVIQQPLKPDAMSLLSNPVITAPLEHETNGNPTIHVIHQQPQIPVKHRTESFVQQADKLNTVNIITQPIISDQPTQSSVNNVLALDLNRPLIQSNISKVSDLHLNRPIVIQNGSAKTIQDIQLPNNRQCEIIVEKDPMLGVSSEPQISLVNLPTVLIADGNFKPTEYKSILPPVINHLTSTSMGNAKSLLVENKEKDKTKKTLSSKIEEIAKRIKKDENQRTTNIQDGEYHELQPVPGELLSATKLIVTTTAEPIAAEVEVHVITENGGHTDINTQSHDDNSKLKADGSRASHRKPKLPRFNIGVASDDEDNGEPARTTPFHSIPDNVKLSGVTTLPDNLKFPQITSLTDNTADAVPVHLSSDPDSSKEQITIHTASGTSTVDTSDILNINMTIDDSDSSFAHFNLDELLSESISDLPIMTGHYSAVDESNKALIESVFNVKHSRDPAGKLPLNSESVIVSGSKREKKFIQCRMCPMKFKTLDALEDHLVTAEHVFKKYKCDLCERKFAALRDSQRHRLIHTGEKPFTCEICNKSFSRKDNLKIHKRMHSIKNHPSDPPVENL